LLEQAQDVERFFKQDLRTAAEQLIGGSKTPKGPCREHTRGICGLHIGVGVAEVQYIAGRYLKLFGDLQSGGGVGLAWH